MGWIDRSTNGIPNLVLVGAGVAAVFGLGALVVFDAVRRRLGDDTVPAASASAPNDVPPVVVDSGPARLSVAGDAAATKDAAPAGPRKVKLADLLGSPKEFDLEDVCTCGFVQSTSTSPDHNVDGTPRDVEHTVYVSERPGLDETAATAVCTWGGPEKPRVGVGQRTCVKGTFSAPWIRSCFVVAKCP